MKTIEEAILLHEQLRDLACHPGAHKDHIYTMHGHATNQENVSLNFQTRIAVRDIPPSDPKYNAFCQGFHCVEINIAARIGGCHHDGSIREGTEIIWQILDRLHGGMAKKTWSNNGCWNSDVIESEKIIPLVKELIGYQEPVYAPAGNTDFSSLFDEKPQ